MFEKTLLIPLSVLTLSGVYYLVGGGCLLEVFYGLTTLIPSLQPSAEDVQSNLVLSSLFNFQDFLHCSVLGYLTLLPCVLVFFEGLQSPLPLGLV